MIVFYEYLLNILLQEHTSTFCLYFIIVVIKVMLKVIKKLTKINVSVVF